MLHYQDDFYAGVSYAMFKEISIYTTGWIVTAIYWVENKDMNEYPTAFYTSVTII